MIEHQPKYPLQTLSKALEILNYMKDSPSSDGVSLAVISQNLNLGKSSTHRILDTLLSYGYVEKSGGGIPTYKLSWQAYKVGSCVPKYHTLNSSNYAIALEHLSKALNRTTTLSILNDYTSIVIYKVEHNRDLPSAYMGLHSPLYATATGKLFMLDFTNEEIERYFNRTQIKRYTPNTILNYIEFLDELNRVKTNDYAIDNCESEENQVCVACPIRDYTKKIVAAISVTDSRENMSAEKIDEILVKLKETCSQISKFLGY